MKKLILILMGLLLTTGAMQATRSPKEQKRLDQELCNAANVENHIHIQQLIDQGANPNTSLLFAARYGLDNAVILLLDSYEVNPNMLTSGYTPLHLAVKHGHKNTTLLLLKHRANPNIPDVNGRVPIFSAMELSEDVYFVRLLLQYGAKTNFICPLTNLNSFDFTLNPNVKDLLIDADETIRLRKLAFAQTNHPRLGKESPARVLNRDLFPLICKYL